MSTKPTFEQAQLHLQVYDQRREAKLRQARDWFFKNYHVTTLDDAMRIAPMCAAGADLSPCGCESAWIRVTHCSTGSYVRTFRGATTFVIRLHIVGLARKTEFRAFELWSREWELNADVLTDPTDRNSARTFYELLDKTTFGRSEVLNHRVGPNWVLYHDGRMEGWLLAQCFSSAPVRYNKACPMPLVVSIINQFDDVHYFRLKLKVEQTVTPIRLWPERRQGLFEPAKGLSSGPIGPPPDVRVRKTPSVGNGLPDTGRPCN